MIKVSVEGVEDVTKILKQAGPRHARNLMRATIHGIASQIAKEAKQNAPKDSGTLKKAIKSVRRKSPPDKPVSEVRVEHGNDAKNDAFYWRFVEYGTRTGMKEHRFIGKAAENAKANFNEILVAQFAKKLEAALKREAKRNSKK